jgi:hypothetical protein
LTTPLLPAVSTPQGCMMMMMNDGYRIHISGSQIFMHMTHNVAMSAKIARRNDFRNVGLKKIISIFLRPNRVLAMA